MGMYTSIECIHRTVHVYTAYIHIQKLSIYLSIYLYIHTYVCRCKIKQNILCYIRLLHNIL